MSIAEIESVLVVLTQNPECEQPYNIAYGDNPIGSPY